MKIRTISDLHHEFGIIPPDANDIDVLVIAGDLNTGTNGILWLKENIKTIPVIYVLGNHEYYGGSYPKTLTKIKDCAAGSNIHVLENEAITLNGVTFHGATLWTDFELYGNPRFYGAMCQERMNDYKRIRRDPSYSRLRTIDTHRIHKDSLLWLGNSLQASVSGINIVVTHHAPSIKSVSDDFKDDYVSSAYSSDLEVFILEHKPDYWLHGHIHTPIEYMIGNTKVICNPYGYSNEPYNGYNAKLTIEL